MATYPAPAPNQFDMVLLKAGTTVVNAVVTQTWEAGLYYVLQATAPFPVVPVTSPNPAGQMPTASVPASSILAVYRAA